MWFKKYKKSTVRCRALSRNHISSAPAGTIAMLCFHKNAHFFGCVVWYIFLKFYVNVCHYRNHHILTFYEIINCVPNFIYTSDFNFFKVLQVLNIFGYHPRRLDDEKTPFNSFHSVRPLVFGSTKVHFWTARNETSRLQKIWIYLLNNWSLLATQYITKIQSKYWVLILLKNSPFLFTSMKFQDFCLK